jgi:DNA-directed RNA polymerase specialized sigma24 family protein
LRSIVEFPPTRWTLVLEAAEGDDAKAQQAMAGLCEHYRSAIQGYFRMKCRDAHAADDLAAAFVLHLLEKNRFRKFVKRENLRFRNYLSRALKFFLCDHLPATPLEPVDPYLETAGTDPEIDKHIDAQLSLAMHQRAVAALHENYGRHGKAARAGRLGSFLFEDPEGDEYQRAAADLGLTLNALYQSVFRLRNDYYERFRAEVAQTVGHGKEELDEETRYLMALLPATLPAEPVVKPPFSS